MAAAEQGGIHPPRNDNRRSFMALDTESDAVGEWPKSEDTERGGISMNSWLTVGLVALAGCAGTAGLSTAAKPAGPPPAVRSAPNNQVGYEFVTDRETRVVSSTVSLSPDRVWPALMEAYRDLGIPLGSIDTAARTLGNPALAAQGQLAGASVSTYLNCGTLLGGPIANTRQVRMSIMNSLHPVGTDSTRIETRVTGSAVDPSSSASPATCTTTGELERRIVSHAFASVLGHAPSQ